METEHFTPISFLLLAWNVLYMVELSSLTSLHSEDGSVSEDAKFHVRLTAVLDSQACSSALGHCRYQLVPCYIQS